MGSITIKGNKDGLTAYINAGSYDSIKEELVDKLRTSTGFFNGCKLLIVDNETLLNEKNRLQLGILLKKEFDIDIDYESLSIQDKKEKVFTNINEGRTKFIKSIVRSGQKISYNGNIVVIGDVNSGAEIIATGNIVILGVLRGIAHAGSNGNSKAFVAAYVMQPAILRIAGVIVRAPDGDYEKPSIPEVASIKENMIVVEPYLPNKYI